MEIDQRKFYMIGIVAFFIVAIMNTVTLLETYKVLLISQILSQIGSLIFNYALLGFFFHLYRSLPPKNINLASEDELESILKIAKDKQEVKKS